MNGFRDCSAKMIVMLSHNVCSLRDYATNDVHGDKL